MVKVVFVFVVVGFFALITSLGRAQDQSGFISIDCGTSFSYFDVNTTINYDTDEQYVDTGTSMTVPNYNLSQQFLNVRSFPEGLKNCYVLTPPRATINDTYLIRASFYYGDYDGKGRSPEFDLHLGVNKWDSVSFSSSSTVVTKEIIHVISSKIIYICLINTGSGTPFISSLELRPLNNSIIYQTKSGSLLLYKRLDFGSKTNEIVRYSEDVYDRIWEPFNINDKTILSSTMPIDNINIFDIPPTIISTAITPPNADETLEFYWNFAASSSQFYMYLHFVELENLQTNQSREFNIFVNGGLFYGPFTPSYLSINTIYSVSPKITEWLNISLVKSANSTLPPIINAIEIYTMKEFLQPQTNEEDANAMMKIKSVYRVERNWQGDPCAPKEFSWEGVKCNYSASPSPRVIYLDLSSIGLTGEISPYISNLTYIQYLDLSNNNLSGMVPEFLSQLSYLSVIKLSKNNLTGPLPDVLLEKISKGLLTLSMDNNTNPCSSVPCKKKNNNLIIAVVASVVVLIILIALITLWAYSRISRKGKVIKLGMKMKLKDTPNRKFTYSDILIITNNLKMTIGKGGFGPVYYGRLEDIEVAVKMLSSSSIQGYKEFLAEIEFLTRVHHVNLTTLVGYCDEGDNIGLVYEYMANGNLKDHLSDRRPHVLSWEDRLRISMDAATGLEYLHHGCKPPIIHRDVKSANILLNEKFQAKLADFGLSRDFPADNTHVSTAVAGTPGYLDPEYYISYKLTEKSDIFSFGVVLLEIITSRPVLTRDQENAHIIQWVTFMLTQEEDIKNIIDPRLGRDFEVNSLQKAIYIAMACASPISIQRPTMNQVVMELKHCLAIEMARNNDSYVTETDDTSIVASLKFDSEISMVGGR